MISIASRAGVGHEFEFEFNGYKVGADLCVNVPESKSFKTAQFCPESSGARTSLHWAPHGGEQRLLVEVGDKRMPFDDAPEILRKALIRWVEKLAILLRRGRYQD